MALALKVLEIQYDLPWHHGTQDHQASLGTRHRAPGCIRPQECNFQGEARLLPSVCWRSAANLSFQPLAYIQLRASIFSLTFLPVQKERKGWTFFREINRDLQTSSSSYHILVSASDPCARSETWHLPGPQEMANLIGCLFQKELLIRSLERLECVGVIQCPHSRTAVRRRGGTPKHRETQLAGTVGTLREPGE